MSLSPAERLLLQRRLARNQHRSGLGGVGSIVVSGFVVVPVLLLVATLSAAMVAGALAYAALAEELEEGLQAINAIEDREYFLSTKILDRNGLLLREVAPLGKRTYIPIDQMPDELLEATVAVEDKDFYTNEGVDLVGIGRAVQGVLTGDATSGGGSTLTQQLVRNIAFSDEERLSQSSDLKYKRKAKEIVLSLILTRQHEKDQILEWYLNEVYYGNLAYGVEAAAETFFDKSAKDLDLAESALLAGLPQAPSAYDPFSPDPEIQEAVKERQEIVLDSMLEEGLITEAEHASALAQELAYVQASEEAQFRAPHFVVYVQELLEQDDGRYLSRKQLARGGLEITTSLDYGMQTLAEAEVREHVDALRDRHDLSSAALVAMEPGTGQVLAMVGSADYWNDAIDGRFNVAVAPRQPGSSIKPITYLTGLEHGMTAAHLFWDVPMEVPAAMLPGGVYKPNNYDHSFHGPVRMRRALGNSYNIPALKALAIGGVDATIETAHKLGITGLQAGADRYGLSLTLGGGEVTLLDMTTAFGTLANLGERVRPNPILKITDAGGAVVYDLADDEDGLEPERAADARAAYIITDMLSDANARTPSFSTGAPLSVGFKAAVKTGTTNDYRDNWTIGYTPYLSIGVWAGNPDNHAMRNTSGITGAAPIWNAVMRQLAGDPERRAVIAAARERYGLAMATDFQRPAGIVEQQVCNVESLKSLSSGCPAYSRELFLKENVPDKDAAWTQQQAVIYPAEVPDPKATPASPDAGPATKVVMRKCSPGPDAPFDRVHSVAVLPLPDDANRGYIGEERRFVVGWADSSGFPSLAGSEPCTPEMLSAALGLDQVAIMGTPGAVSVAGAGEQAATGGSARYSLGLAPGAVVRSRIELTGTVQYDPALVEYFKVEFGAGQQPYEWRTLGSTHTGPIVNGVLEILDAPSLPPGPSVVRLVLVKSDGNFLNPPYSVPIEIVRAP